LTSRSVKFEDSAGQSCNEILLKRIVANGKTLGLRKPSERNIANSSDGMSAQRFALQFGIVQRGRQASLLGH